MSREEALQWALSQNPCKIGVGRLCQELLASVTGLEVPTQTYEFVGFDKRGPKMGKPWSEARRAAYEANKQGHGRPAKYGRIL